MHYHIRWSTKEVLDWEAFDSRKEAEEVAQQLVRPGETYAIIERDGSCPRCWKSFQLKTSHSDPNRAYPWQQAVLDAVTEAHPEHRAQKINAAQLAVSARLTELTPSDLNEQAAIRDALRTLSALLPERRDKDEFGGKKATA